MMRNRLWISAVVAFLTPLVGCGDAASSGSAAAAEVSRVAPRAEEVQPVTVGMAAPTAALSTPAGEMLRLGDAYARQPTLLIFYRGGWCPFCSAHLGEIAMIEADLTALGVQLLAVSPDRPEKLKESMEDRQLGYLLLSDSDMTLTRAFGLAFRLSDQEVEQYLRMGFDLEDASGYDHHLLPVPAVYLVDRQGVIRFAHWDPNYRERIDVDVLITAIQRLLPTGS